jgi:oligopeptide/dipeptide ABC transporter ATP-binding protein
MSQSEPILDIRNLHTHFRTPEGFARALNGVTFPVFESEITGVVGETGSGKSVTALSVLNLIEYPGEITKGEIIFGGHDLLRMTEKEITRIRGKKISMIFQDARLALNPLMPIGKQIGRLLKLHRGTSKEETKNLTVELLRLVEMPDPEKRIYSFPHELSSGMCQRVMIALALCGNPKLIIADEPTTGLDVTVQSQILDLIVSRVKATHASCLFITHDFGVIAKVCDRVVVMYSGRVVEQGSVNDVFQVAKHPYTQSLLMATLRPDKTGPILSIPGTVPNAINLPSGCPFHPRCQYAKKICHQKEPGITVVGKQHSVSCFLTSGEIKMEQSDRTSEIFTSQSDVQEQ